MTTAVADQLVHPENLADVTIRPVSGHIGAEVDGINLSQPLSEAQRTLIQSTLNRWKVVVFRDQHLGHREHVAFARQFGELTYAHPYDSDPPEGFPEVFTVSPERFAKQYGITGADAEKLRRRYSYTNEWHTDVTPAVNPPAGSVLRAEVVPEFGGDTTFTNLAAAYEGLSPTFQTVVDGLVAEHRYGASLTRKGVPSNSVVSRNPLVAHHPVVRVHPITGERSLFVTPEFTSRIVGLRHEESEPLLRLLFDHITRPAYTARFRWTPGTVVFWDNRATAHLGPQDIDHLDVGRVLHRVTLIGEVPVGPNGRQSELIEGVPFEAIAPFDPDAN